MNESITINLPKINGYTFTGEFRPAVAGEHIYLKSTETHDTVVKVVKDETVRNYFILEVALPRAPEGGEYFYVDSFGGVMESVEDGYCSGLHYRLGNYFLDKEDAKEAAFKLQQFYKDIRES